MAYKSGQLGVSYRGMSVTFKHNAPEYATFTKTTKEQVRRSLRATIDMWAAAAVDRARAYCPVYSGNLEESIVATAASLFGGITGKGRYSVQVGVLESWKSPFDYSFRGGDGPPWGLSSPAVVSVLHEAWEAVAGPRARARAAKKGPDVGSKFLLRAGEDATRIFEEEIYSYKSFGSFLEARPSKRQLQDQARISGDDGIDESPFE